MCCKWKLQLPNCHLHPSLHAQLLVLGLLAICEAGSGTGPLELDAWPAPGAASVELHALLEFAVDTEDACTKVSRAPNAGRDSPEPSGPFNGRAICASKDANNIPATHHQRNCREVRPSC